MLERMLRRVFKISIIHRHILTYSKSIYIQLISRLDVYLVLLSQAGRCRTLNYYSYHPKRNGLISFLCQGCYRGALAPQLR